MEKQQAIKQLLEQGLLPTAENISKFQTAKGKLSVEVINSFDFDSEKIEIADFSKFLRARYQAIKNLLFNRTEGRGAVSINYAKSQSGKVTLIAMVKDISKMPSGTLRLELEDLSGNITAILSKKSENFDKLANFICLDEIAAFTGSAAKNTFFINDIIYPDIPTIPITLSEDDVYVAFTGDLHIGSNQFLPDKLQKFINWLKGEEGNDKQKEIASKTKYIFILGDIVDGVGIYPEQYKEQTITDIYEQYKKAYEFLSQIPSDKQIIIQGGNHDALRIAEPQPVLNKKYAKELYEMKNVTMVSNPAWIKVHNSLKVLMYHGYSFNYYLNDIEGIRLAGGYDKPELVMKYLLQRRHLAPTYGSTLALPLKEDCLMISNIPDVFASGHIHKAAIAKYKNTLLISGSCWQNNTSFQDKVGLKPDPCLVPILNLKTGKARMLNFK